jgi:hypothetical protein
MILETSLTILRANPQYHLLLAAYLERDQREREQQEEFSGWLSRVNSVEGIESDVMSRIHGKLISLGLLKFELGDRLEGIRYQLSDDAKRALQQLAESGTSPEESEEFEDDDFLDQESQNSSEAA